MSCISIFLMVRFILVKLLRRRFCCWSVLVCGLVFICLSRMIILILLCIGCVILVVWRWRLIWYVVMFLCGCLSVVCVWVVLCGSLCGIGWVVRSRYECGFGIGCFVGVGWL